MSAKIRLLHIQWFKYEPLRDTHGEPVYPPQVDGQATYEILHPNG